MHHELNIIYWYNFIWEPVIHITTQAQVAANISADVAATTSGGCSCIILDYGLLIYYQKMEICRFRLSACVY